MFEADIRFEALNFTENVSYPRITYFILKLNTIVNVEIYIIILFSVRPIFYINLLKGEKTVTKRGTYLWLIKQFKIFFLSLYNIQ